MVKISAVHFYNCLLLYRKCCLQNIEMIANFQGSIWPQQTSTLLQLLALKQQSVANALLSKNKSAKQTHEIQQFIEIMRKLQQIQQKNIEKSLQKIQKKCFYEYLKVLFASRQECFRIHDCQIQFIQKFVNGLNKIIYTKSFRESIYFSYRNNRYQRVLQSLLEYVYQDKKIIDQVEKYIQLQTPKLIIKLNAMIRLLIQRFQRYEKDIGLNGSIKNFMAQQIQILRRSIQRSTIKEQQLTSIAGCQTIKNSIFEYNYHLNTEQFNEWKESSKKVQILQECIDYAFALSMEQSIEVNYVTITYLSKEQNTILKQILPKFTHIISLSLKSCHLGNEIIDFIKQIIHLNTLQLSDNHIDNEGVKYLSQIKFQKIQYLTMDSNPITNKGIYYLAKAHWAKIFSISMQNCPITASSLKAIFKIVSLQYFYFPQGDLINRKKYIEFRKFRKQKYFLSLDLRQLEQI